MEIDFAQEMQFKLGENHYDERFEFVGLFQVKTVGSTPAKVGPKLAHQKAQTERDNSDVTYFCVFVRVKQYLQIPIHVTC